MKLFTLRILWWLDEKGIKPDDLIPIFAFLIGLFVGVALWFAY